MRRFVCLLSLPLLLAACGPETPQEGDIYENLLSGNRMEIMAVGSCEGIAATVAESEAVAPSQNQAISSQQAEAVLNGSVLVNWLSDDRTGTCFGYMTEGSVAGRYLRFFSVVNVDDSEEWGREWQKVN